MTPHEAFTRGHSAVSEWVHRNLVLIVPLAIILGAVVNTFMFNWDGSPRAIIKHVDHADSMLRQHTDSANTNLMSLMRLMAQTDSTLQHEIVMLGDSVDRIALREDVVMVSVCRSLDEQQKLYLRSIFKC